MVPRIGPGPFESAFSSNRLGASGTDRRPNLVADPPVTRTSPKRRDVLPGILLRGLSTDFLDLPVCAWAGPREGFRKEPGHSGFPPNGVVLCPRREVYRRPGAPNCTLSEIQEFHLPLKLREFRKFQTCAVVGRNVEFSHRPAPGVRRHAARQSLHTFEKSGRFRVGVLPGLDLVPIALDGRPPHPRATSLATQLQPVAFVRSVEENRARGDQEVEERALDHAIATAGLDKQAPRAR